MPAQIKIPKGSHEKLYINVTDRLEELTTLDSAAINYEVWENDADMDNSVPKATGICNNSLMTVITSPIDTTNYEEGNYRLYLEMLLGAETIRLGPFTFIVG